MKRKLKIINVSIVVLMAVFVVWGFWNNCERSILNKQYEELIEQFSRHVEERDEINQRYKQLVDQMEVDHEASNQEVEDLRRRFQQYLDRLEDEIQ